MCPIEVPGGGGVPTSSITGNVTISPCLNGRDSIEANWSVQLPSASESEQAQVRVMFKTRARWWTVEGHTAITHPAGDDSVWQPVQIYRRVTNNDVGWLPSPIQADHFKTVFVDNTSGGILNRSISNWGPSNILQGYYLSWGANASNYYINYELEMSAVMLDGNDWYAMKSDLLHKLMTEWVPPTAIDAMVDVEMKVEVQYLYPLNPMFESSIFSNPIGWSAGGLDGGEPV